MALLTRSYTPPAGILDADGYVVWTPEDIIELQTQLLAIKNTGNNIDDTNIPDGGTPIDMDKIANGGLLEYHASRHASGGQDPLKPSSINGAMLQPRCINGSHLQKGCILTQHLGYADSIEGLIYLDDTVLTATDGATISAPSGYTDFRVLVLGFDVNSGAADAGICNVTVGVTAGAGVYTVACYAAKEDAPGGHITGSIYYIRMAWK